MRAAVFAYLEGIIVVRSLTIEGSYNVRDLGGYELASRFSYFLWASMPDDDLFARAADGTLRDTVVYSITAAEWPAVKTHLNWQLARNDR